MSNIRNKALLSIAADIADRKTLRQAMESIDDDIVEEIMSCWGNIIEKAIQQTRQCQHPAFYEKTPPVCMECGFIVKEHCPRRLMGEHQEPHAPCDTGDLSRDNKS